MQILHFDWLRYYRSISNSHRVAKFAGFANQFISFYSQINIFSAEFIIAFFCPTSWVILKQLDPSPSRATDQGPFGLASWAIDPQPFRATGLIVNYNHM